MGSCSLPHPLGKLYPFWVPSSSVWCSWQRQLAQGESMHAVGSLFLFKSLESPWQGFWELRILGWGYSLARSEAQSTPWGPLFSFTDVRLLFLYSVSTSCDPEVPEVCLETFWEKLWCANNCHGLEVLNPKGGVLNPRAYFMQAGGHSQDIWPVCPPRTSLVLGESGRHLWISHSDQALTGTISPFPQEDRRQIIYPTGLSPRLSS